MIRLIIYYKDVSKQDKGGDLVSRKRLVIYHAYKYTANIQYFF